MRLISKQAFRDYIEFRGFTNEALADEAKRLARKDKEHIQCSPTLIAFLRSEKKSARDTCKPKTAKYIEKALNAPPGSLFAAEVIVASPSTKGRAA